MVDIVEIRPESRVDWNAFVENHPFGWLYHRSEWCEVLVGSFRHMKPRYLALIESETDSIRAALPLFEVNSWLTSRRLVSVPFATLFDPLVSDAEELKVLLDAAVRLSAERRCRYLEIRTMQSDGYAADGRLARTETFRFHNIELDTEPDKLKKSFHRSCVRQRIDRALKSDIEVQWPDGEESLKTFYWLFQRTRSRIGLPTQPWRYFLTMWHRFFPLNQIALVCAVRDSQLLAGLLLLVWKDRVSAEFYAWDDRYVSLSPGHLLFWESINWAYERGYRNFDFGRTSRVNHGLIDFKRRWRTTESSLPIYYYPASYGEAHTDEMSSATYKVASMLCRKTPAVFQKNLGNFFYRHLG